MLHRTHRPRGRRSAALAAGLVAAGWTLAVAGPASANVSGPCDGRVTIDGVTYTPANDTPGDPIVVPADARTAEWEGTTGVPITDHTGRLGVVIGPGSVQIASWGGENADLETSAAGAYDVGDARGELPVDLVGLYELTGMHSGSGGTCAGSAMVLIEGSPLTTPAGAGAAAVTVLSLLGLAAAGTTGAGTPGAGATGAGPTAGGTEPTAATTEVH